MDPSRRCRIDGSEPPNVAGCFPWPQHTHPVNHEIAAEKGPIGLDETKHSTDLDIFEAAGFERRPDELYLLVHAVDQFCAISRSDDQCLGARASPTAVDTKAGALPLVLLGIDDEDARRTDNNVIDVGLGGRDAPVVENVNARLYDGVELSAQSLLSLRAGGPRFGALWVIAQSEDEATDARVSLANP